MNLKQFEIVKHSNGTFSVRDTESEQVMHSRIGAWEEAVRVYAESAPLFEKMKESSQVILHDVGMGTAANAIAAIEQLKKQNAKGTLIIESFETKPNGLKFALAHLNEFNFLTDYQQHLLELLNKKITTFKFDELQIVWRLHEGDFFKNLYQAQKPDFIFYDFYSPKADQSLWSEDSFKKIKNYLGEHPCCLYTYSSATPVRLNILLAGFFIGKGLHTEMKTETTVASTVYKKLMAPLGEQWRQKIFISPAIESDELRERALRHPQWNYLNKESTVSITR